MNIIILGHGIVVTSRYGNVTLDNVHIHDNGGDGDDMVVVIMNRTLGGVLSNFAYNGAHNTSSQLGGMKVRVLGDGDG